MATVRDVDRGWGKIRAYLRLIDNSYTKVGLPEDGTVAPPTRTLKENEVAVENMSEMVMVGAANEFGTSRIPERSFMRSTTDENREKIKQLQERLYYEALSRRRSVRESLSILGEYLTGKVRNKIVAIRTPPNAPSTLRKKYPKTNPLIDKGQMVQSIQHEEVLKI